MNNMANEQTATQNKGPNLKLLGFKSPMEVIDILSIIKIDGEPVIKDDKAFLDPNLKAQEVISYFKKNFDIDPNLLPYFASVIKNKIKERARN
jgi:hypothetical protein